MRVWHVCSAELEMNGEISVLVVKVIKDVAEAEMVDREMEALAAVQGMPHFIQQVDSKYHRHADDSGPALIVTRYAHHLICPSTAASSICSRVCSFSVYIGCTTGCMHEKRVGKQVFTTHKLCQSACTCDILTSQGPPPTSCPSLHASVVS